MRKIALFVALAITTVGIGCKKKSPPTDSTSSAPVVEECRPLACSEKCPCGSRQKCVVGVCGWDPAYHIQQIGLGAGTFACALYANGEVWCAGKNVVGELGNGKMPGGPSALDEPPAKVVGIGTATEIAAGVFHACALVSGSVWCWGMDGSGELGAHVDLPGGVGQMTGTPVKVNRLDDAIEIAVGNAHSCAIKKDHSVVCWGGHPGEGLTDQAGARPIKGVTKARALALNLQSSCALQDNGAIACWGVDGPASNVAGIKNAQGLALTQFSTCAYFVDRRTLSESVKCWGGRFGAKPVDIPYLANTNFLAGGNDLVCGVVAGSRELRCSDTKAEYRAMMNETEPVAARLLAVSGEWTLSVRFGGDVVDADDRHPSKAVIDQLGSGSIPAADDLVPPSERPKVVEAVPSCDARSFNGTCVEYTNGSAGSDAQTECQQENGKWSQSASCPREGAYGTCAVGTKNDRGATMIIFPSQYAKDPIEARVMCQAGSDGTFTPLGSP